MVKPIGGYVDSELVNLVNARFNEYKYRGIPFQGFVNNNEISGIKGNVIHLNRAIVLKPITREKVVEVMVEEIREKVVHVPQVHVVDKYVEVVKPVVKYKIKEIKRPVTVERIKRVPKIVEEDKIVEVPEVQYLEKIVDVPTIVEREKIVEVPFPVVCERRIPVLNISRNERVEEIPMLDGMNAPTEGRMNDDHNGDVWSHDGHLAQHSDDHNGDYSFHSPQRDDSLNILEVGAMTISGQDCAISAYDSRVANCNSDHEESLDQMNGELGDQREPLDGLTDGQRREVDESIMQDFAGMGDYFPGAQNGQYGMDAHNDHSMDDHTSHHPARSFEHPIEDNQLNRGWEDDRDYFGLREREYSVDPESAEFCEGTGHPTAREPDAQNVHYDAHDVSFNEADTPYGVDSLQIKPRSPSVGRPKRLEISPELKRYLTNTLTKRISLLVEMNAKNDAGEDE